MLKMEILKRCPICKLELKDKDISTHIRSFHTEEELKAAILNAKEMGMSDPEIGRVFGITFKQLEKIITEAYGVNISILKRQKRIKTWAPANFKEENTTVWSFKQRGSWATHDGGYRGNWSPYIPRNIILKYSKPGDIVLDYFVGGGTTAVEAKLLGRRCIARDINPLAIELTRENVNFHPPKDSYEIFEPQIHVGDARVLSDIVDESIDLICAHPPYAGIIKYSSKVKGDLSELDPNDFLKEMEKVAKESYRVLKPEGKCAILIGDTRKNKYIIPIGFKLIRVFLNAGFKLRELIVKRQHNCKTTGFWYSRSLTYNFLLLAHEYLPVFEKSEDSLCHPIDYKSEENDLILLKEEPAFIELDNLETTTVWILPSEQFEDQLDSNVIKRYCKDGEYLTLRFSLKDKNLTETISQKEKTYDLLYLKSFLSKEDIDLLSIEKFKEKLKDISDSISVKKNGYLAINLEDVRINGYIIPLALEVIETLEESNNLRLKEIIIATTENQRENNKDGKYLKITHRYLLIYEIIK